MPTRRERRLKASPSPAPDTPETSFRPGQPLELRTSCISKPSIEPPMSNPAGSGSRASSCGAGWVQQGRGRLAPPCIGVARAGSEVQSGALLDYSRRRAARAGCSWTPPWWQRWWIFSLLHRTSGRRWPRVGLCQGWGEAGFWGGELLEGQGFNVVKPASPAPWVPGVADCRTSPSPFPGLMLRGCCPGDV